MHNPMIFIPEHNAVVFGCESWWDRIKDESHLRAITDADIENVWHVKALRWLAAASTPSPAVESPASESGQTPGATQGNGNSSDGESSG